MFEISFVYVIWQVIMRSPYLASWFMGKNLKSIFKITIKHNFFASSAEIEAPLAVVALELKYFISLGKLIFFH